VAQAKLRLAAGVAMTAMCLLVGGTSSAVAIADPGHRGHSGHSNKGKGSDNDRRGSGGSRSDSPRGGGSDWSDDNLIEITEAPRLAKIDDDNDKNDNNNGNNAGGEKSASDSRPSSRLGSGRESGTSRERRGSDYSPDPPGPVKAPKVTFGDGRSPGVQDHEPEPRWSWSPPELAPPPPPPPPQVITVPLKPATVSPVRIQSGVVEQLVIAPTSGLGDPLWGVAGLLLIPAAGAILGYRQARGAHAAAELGRRP